MFVCFPLIHISWIITLPQWDHSKTNTNWDYIVWQFKDSKNNFLFKWKTNNLSIWLLGSFPSVSILFVNGESSVLPKWPRQAHISCLVLSRLETSLPAPHCHLWYHRTIQFLLKSLRMRIDTGVRKRATWFAKPLTHCTCFIITSTFNITKFDLINYLFLHFLFKYETITFC